MSTRKDIEKAIREKYPHVDDLKKLIETSQFPYTWNSAGNDLYNNNLRQLLNRFDLPANINSKTWLLRKLGLETPDEIQTNAARTAIKTSWWAIVIAMVSLIVSAIALFR